MSAEIPAELAEHVARAGGTLHELHGQWFWTQEPKIGETYVQKFSYTIVSDTHIRTEDDRLLRRDVPLGLAEIPERIDG